MLVKSVLRLTIVAALAASVSGNSAPSDVAHTLADGTCGYALSTGTCPSLSVIVDECPQRCGNDTYLGACHDDMHVGYEPTAICYQIES